MDLVEHARAEADSSVQRDALPPVSAANRYGSIDVVLKVVERCNLACPYCYFFFADDDSFKRHPPTIPSRTIDALLAYLHDAIDNHGIQMVKIGLHGGEPLMMKKPAFRAMCARFRDELGPKCRLMITMQTNGVLIDEEWIDIFAELRIRIGVSVDGPKHIHNLTRITKKGRGTYDETRRGWELLRAAADQGRITDPGMLCVVNPAYSGQEAFDHIIGELRSSAVNFLLPDITHDSPEATEAFIAGCGRFMIEVYNAWAASDGKATVRFIYEAVGPMTNDDSCRSIATGKYDPMGLIVVSSDGEISPDDVLRGIDARFRDTGVSLFQHGVIDTLSHPLWQELAQAQARPHASCTECLWFNACRGGSPQHRYSKERGFDNPSVYCEELKRYHRYVASSLVSSGYDGTEIERRLDTRWVHSPVMLQYTEADRQRV